MFQITDIYSEGPDLNLNPKIAYCYGSAQFLACKNTPYQAFHMVILKLYPCILTYQALMILAHYALQIGIAQSESEMANSIFLFIPVYLR